MVRFATLVLCAALAAAPAAAAAAPARLESVAYQRDRDWRGGGGPGGGWRGRDARDAAPQRDIRRMPLQRVLRSVESRTPGRLLDASIQDLGGREVYRVRWASDDGRRLDFVIDASSGQILSAE